MSLEESKNMEYRKLGNTGLKASVIGFGAMTFRDVESAKELISTARKGGVNFFDTAEMYGENFGDSETIFGKALNQLQQEDPVLYRRSDLIITAKIFIGGTGLQEKGLHRKHLIEAINHSLKRLQLDYVDIVFAHRYDALTPMVEIVHGFNNIISNNKAFYWGTSEWTPVKVCEAFWLADKLGLLPPVVEQPEYNLLTRDNIEKHYLDLFKYPYNIGLTTWSPLCGGFLTGKYIDEDINAKKRVNVGPMISNYWSNLIDNMIKKKGHTIKHLMEYAKTTLNSDITTLSLAWVIKNRNVSVMLVGASKPEQLEKNLECLKLARNLTKQNMDDIDKILGNKPHHNDDPFELIPPRII